MLKLPLVRSVIFGILFASTLVGGLSVLNLASAAGNQDCDSNAVIYCGASSMSDMSSKYNNGDGNNSGGNIQHIYSWFGINSNDMQSMDSNVRNGTVTRSGDVYVGDQLVATNAMTAGRQNMPGSTKQTSQGTTFYTRPPSVSFASDRLDSYVVMKNGAFQYAIIKSCGNPVKATPKAPQAPPKPSTAPKPTPAAPAKPAKPVANICTGNTTNSNSNGTASQGGNCSINTTTVVQQAPPQAPTPTPPTPPTPNPSGQCTNLSVIASPDNGNPLTVEASVTYTVQNGAQLQNIAYDFGDGTTSPPTTQTSMSHTYAQTGSYTITAVLTFSGTAANTSSAATTVSTSANSSQTSSNGTTTSNNGSTSTNPSTNTNYTDVNGTVSNNGTNTTPSNPGSAYDQNSMNTNVNATNNSNTNQTVAPSTCQASITVAPAPTPPAPAPVTPVVTPPAPAPVTPVVAPPQQLVNTGAGSIIGLFGVSAAISTLAYRFYLRRHLSS
jgi:hypothetical protein